MLERSHQQQFLWKVCRTALQIFLYRQLIDCHNLIRFYHKAERAQEGLGFLALPVEVDTDGYVAQRKRGIGTLRMEGELAVLVDKYDKDEQGVPQRFELIGAGWGHGVGLCQIGAAVMGEQGYHYDAILLHYYQGAEIKKLYK